MTFRNVTFQFWISMPSPLIPLPPPLLPTLTPPPPTSTLPPSSSRSDEAFGTLVLNDPLLVPYIIFVSHEVYNRTHEYTLSLIAAPCYLTAHGNLSPVVLAILSIRPSFFLLYKSWPYNSFAPILHHEWVWMSVLTSNYYVPHALSTLWVQMCLSLTNRITWTL